MSSRNAAVTPTLSSPRSSWKYVPLAVVQLSVFVAIVYSTWHFGAVHAIALQHLVWIAAIGLVAGLVSALLRTQVPARLPTTFWVLLAIWISYAFVQSTSLSSVTIGWFDRAYGHASEFRSGAEQLAEAATTLTGQQLPQPTILPGSVAYELTKQAVVPYLLVLGFSLLATIGFQSDRSRLILLWTIVLNATALATWGIVQRSAGGIELLPGVTNRAGGSPFGSFIYKNAGAAALLPAIACLIAIALLRPTRHRNASSWSGDSIGWTRSIFKQFDAMFVPCWLFLSGVLVTGLIASLSRGAWLSASLSVLIVGWLMGARSLSRRVGVMLAGGALLIIGIAVTTGITDEIQHQAQRVSVKSVWAEQRWGAWADGVTAALAYLPSGSGLGTFGYATLPFQSQPRIEWFRDAHNQYLEVLAETGLIGIVIVAWGLVWFGRSCYCLLRAGGGKIRRGSVRYAWAMIGWSLLVCGAVQNTFDFVIKIPAVAILYAVLLSIVATTRLKSRRMLDRPPDISHDGSRPAISAVLVLWLCLGLGSLFLAHRITARQVACERVLGTAAIAGDAELDSSDLPGDVIQTLDRAIAIADCNAALYSRRAWWHQRQYEQELIRTARTQGITLSKDNAGAGTIHALLASLPESEQTQLRADFVGTPELRRLLGNTIADLYAAILLNPHDLQPQFRSALLSPLGGYPIDPWLRRSGMLAKNHHETLFNNGLLAYYRNDSSRMVEQWSASLAIRQARLSTILRLASHKLPLVEVVRELVPDNRADQIVLLAQAYRDAPATEFEGARIEELLAYVQDTTRFASADKHAALGGLHDLLGNRQLAIKHWKQSSILAPLNSQFRLSLVNALRDDGRWQDALDQAVLGQRLFPSDNRFNHEARSIRRNLINL